MKMPAAKKRIPAPRPETAARQAPSGRKLTKVVEAAWRLFSSDGYEATNMERIAREAGVSKATLYTYFASKESLFEHLIAEECRRAQPLVTMPDLSSGVAAALRSFAKQYTRIFADNDPQRMALFQILVAEAGRFPKLGQLMIDSGPKAEAQRLADLLESAKRNGLLDIEDCVAAAAQFLCLVRGELPIQSALGVRRWTQAEIDRTIEGGLGLFLKAYAPPAKRVSRAKSPQRNAASPPTATK